MRLLTNGMTIGKAKVIVDIIPKGNPEIRPGTSQKIKYITIHDTGNAGRGADAIAHNKYIHNIAKKSPKDTTHVSWHVTVDEDFIYQHIPFDERAWHCGDGANGPGNASSIGIEICMHVDQKNRSQAEANAAALVNYLLNTLDLTESVVKPHQAWSGKFCPQVILKRDGSLKKFIERVNDLHLSGKPLVKANISTETHVVIKGDTLEKIAKSRGTTVSAIREANSIKGDLIYVGQTLLVPSKSTTPFRVKSGTYLTGAAAQQAADKVAKLGIASAKNMRVVKGPTGLFHWETGSYKGVDAAAIAVEAIKANRIASVVHVIKI